MKKFTLVLFTLLTLIPINIWAEVTTIDGVTYEYSGSIATVKSIDASITSAIIPATITIEIEETSHIYNVTSIASNAFSGCTELRTLTIEAEITSSNFASNALKDCESLQTLIFKQCSSLSSLNINFVGSSISSNLCIVYHGIKYYHQKAWSAADNYFSVGNESNSTGFDNSTKNESSLNILENVCKIPVTKIAKNAFSKTAENCSINIPKSITTISDLSFVQNKLTSINVANDNPNYKDVNGVLFSKDGTTLISFPTKKANSYTIPTGVTDIGNDAFNNHVDLSSITIPTSVTTIGRSAFQYAGRNTILSVSFTSGSKLTTIERNAFQESGVKTITFPNGLTTIEASAFFNCTKLTTVNFPSSITSIGATAFAKCENLTTLNNFSNKDYSDGFNLENNLTIGSSAFYDCKLSSNLYLPEKITSIGKNAFNYSNNFSSYSALKSLYLPSTANFSNAITNDYVKVYRKIDIDFEGKYTTYFSTMDLELPNILTAYTITDGDETNLTPSEPLHYIHQGKPLILELADGKTKSDLPEYYGIPKNETIALDANFDFETNLLHGSTTTTNLNNIHGNKYILSGDKFVKIVQGTLPAFRCYLVLDSEIDAPADYYTFNNDGNSYVYKEEGEFIKKNVKIGSASLSVTDGNNTGTLTVSPKKGFYATKITLIRSVKASSARAPQINATPITLTPSVEDADPSGETTYTFPHTNGATYEVTVDFYKRKNLSDNGATRKINFTLPSGGYTYDGQPKEPEITSVTFNGNVVESKNYDVNITNNVNAGSATITVTGKREYMNSYSETFPIAQRNINNVTIGVIAPQTYTGSEIKPEVTITDEMGDIIQPEDYVITYDNNINKGTTAKVIVTAQSKNYTSVTDKTFTINPKNLTNSEDLKITDIPAEKYTGDPIEPTLEIKDGIIILSPENDYDVTYTDNTVVGTAYVNITFKGNYEGNAQTTFMILEQINERPLNVSFEGENQWATFFWEDEYLSIPDGLNVYAIARHEGNSTTLNLQQLHTMIPANVAVLLERTGEQKDGFVANTMDANTTLEEGITPDNTLFIGSKNGITDLSTVEGTKFVLVNDEFVQTTGGSLPKNRCYLNFGSTTLDGVNTIDINTGADDIIYKVDGNKSTAGGTATKSDITDGKITLTVNPNDGYYAEVGDITVTRSVSASSSRAPSVDGGNVAVTAVDTTKDPSGITTYTFNATSNSKYQVAINFHKCTDFSKSESKPVITLKPGTYIYNGQEQTPEIESVVCGGNTLDAKDYEFARYVDNINAGTGKVYITGKRKFIGENNTTFKINQRTMSSVKVDPIDPITYTGDPIEPGLNITDFVKINDEDVDILNKVEGKPDYKVVFSNNTNTGTAHVTIQSNNINYTGSKTGFTFEIKKKNLSLPENKPTIDPIADQEYDEGNAITPTLSIKDGTRTLVNGTDYDVEYSNNTEAGLATAIITFKGNYEGSAEQTFNIVDDGLPKKSVTVNFDSKNEWTTFYSAETLSLQDLSETLEAYVVTDIDIDHMTITDEKAISKNDVPFIPKNTPVLLHRISGEETSFDLKTCSGEKLPDNVILSDKFVGTTEDMKISTISGTKFVLLNGKFIQAAEGTLKANRCYLVVADPIDVAELTIRNGNVNKFIYQENGTITPANIGTASTSTPKDGKVTLTVKPKKGYYVELSDITVVRNANAESARASKIDIDNSKVTITSGKITDNDDYTTKYEFTYPYEKNCQYQITVNFHKSTNLQESGKKPKITLDKSSFEYDMSEHTPVPTVILGDVKLKKDIDYKIRYDKNKNAGEGVVYINGIRKYTNEVNKTFTITKRDINKVSVKVDKSKLTYTGDIVEPLIITDMVGEKDIINDNEYTITYDPEDHTNAGKVKATIEGKNNYTGKRDFTFEIQPKNLTGKVTIEDINPIDETGKPIEPKLAIKDGTTELKVNEDYIVEYKDNVKDGTAKAIVTFIGNYIGTAEKTFTIKHVAKPVTLNIQFNDNNEWTTFFWNDYVSVPEGLKAYIIVGVSGKVITPKEVDFIPEDVPVLLHRENKSKTAPFIGYTMPSDTKLNDNIKPYSKFHGTLEGIDIATISGSKFILLNDQFIQTIEGTLPANRCYINATVDGIATLTIGKAIDERIYLEEGKPSTAGGKAETSTPSEKGLITLTVKPNTHYYAEPQNITVISSANAVDARAPQIDGSNVEITPIDKDADPSGITKYTFKYSEGYHYQITIDFQKCTNFSIKENLPMVTLDKTNFVYDGTEKKPKVKVVFGDKKLIENTDYAVNYKNNTNAGAANVVITGKGHYSGEYSGTTFNIARRTINSGQVKVEFKEKSFTYTGKPIEPKLTITESIKIGDEIVNIITTEDFKVSKYENNINASTNEKKAMIAIEGIRNYKDFKDIFFEILPKELTTDNVQEISDQDYTGDPIEPELVIKDGDYTLKLDNPDDYDVKFSDNIYEGTANVDITFKGNYKGSAKRTFKINFKVLKRKLDITFDDKNQWTTFYWHENLNIKDQGLIAYVVTGHEEGSTKLITEDVDFIPANVGVLLYRTDNSNAGPFYGKSMPINTELTGVIPDKNLFVGTQKGIEDLSKIDGVKFILVNDQFVQAVEGSLPANRCYVNFGNAEGIDGISDVDTDKDVDAIIILEEGKENEVGKVSLSKVQKGKKMLTVEPYDGFYAEANNITIIRSASGGSARAAQIPSVEDSKVTVTATKPSDDPSKKTTYTFPYEDGYHYQITVNFQKRSDFSKPETQATIIFDATNIEYNGKEQKPTNIVVKSGDTPVDPSNYTISYEENIAAGPSYVVITGKRLFIGTKKQEFIIKQRDIKQVTVKDIPDQEYTGNPITPVLDITDIIAEDGSNIIDESQYKLVYENNTEIGKAKVNIVAKNINYHNTKVVYFNIIPATGIDQIAVEEQEGQWYDLNGQRINRPTQKGIYILRDKNKKMKKVRVK